MHARRPSGRQFVLTIERCSGEIVSARPLEGYGGTYGGGGYGGPYAYGGPPPRRYERPYY